ncbi:hypothetical protein OsJ_29941 [Oryza sativa Japonica Group]|uniref:F-box domain-containing protein n=1 Tax=Oryza sativa subsp. japonica TaxID=39947 RepID=B9G4G5_ORYSJ|nr:hypothetical protein OsJ_29941 [Oryza sativa Japonica Group]
MGLLVLKRLMSVQQERRHIQARMAKRKGSVCLQLANSEGGKIMGYSGLNLPEDIWSHIHSLMPLRDAARAACVSRAFRSFWRYHPNLIFRIETPDLNFIKKVDCILKNHSGIGIKSLRFESGIFYNASTSYYLDSWLQIAVTPLIEELTLGILSYNTNYFDSKYDDEYNFPCSLLSDGRGSSMRHLYLSRCSFHPTINLELRNLTRLHLAFVHITGNELGCVLSNSYALERLELNYCYGIICVKIPCLLQRLSHLEVFECRMLQVIENSAPNLGSFHFGINHVQLLLGESLQMKSLSMCYPGAVYYACAELPSNVPNLETLTIGSPHEVSQERMGHVSIFGDSLQLRQMPEHHRHGNLQSVKITGFCSAKSLIELTCYILDNTTSLKCLTLDTTRGVSSCSTGEHKKCFPIGKMLTEANRAVLAIETFIERKVPSTVKLAVTKPCSRCHVKS